MTDMNEIVKEANIALWQAYCDKKMELEQARMNIQYSNHFFCS